MKTQSIFFVSVAVLLSFIVVFVYSATPKSTAVSEVNAGNVVTVYPFSQQATDSAITWTAITAERKTIELLVRSGMQVRSHLTRFQTSGKPDFHIKGTVSKKDSLITVALFLYNSSEKKISSGTLQGTIRFFRSIRNVMGETVLFSLHVDKTLALQKDKKKITVSNNAYALILKAKQQATAEQYDRAIGCLHRALIYDPACAAACWMAGQLYKEKGVSDSAALWTGRAEKIDAHHPKTAYKDSVDKKQPLQDLLKISRTQPFVTLTKGIAYKQIMLNAHAVTALVWVIDPDKFAVTIQTQSRNTGSHITEFLTDSLALLALNGGFFEMDGSYALSASGLIISNGTQISPKTDFGGSGVFCIKNNIPSIRWAKDSIDFRKYACAFQGGPVTVEPGRKLGVYNNDYIRLNRSAIGISEGKVVLAVVAGQDGVGLSLYEFAQFLRSPRKKGGAGCDAALNLDGGSSTQVCFSYKNTTVSIPGLWAIQSAIVVKKNR